MIDYLPLRFILDVEKKEFGPKIFNLAVLDRHEIKVPQGGVIFTPLKTNSSFEFTAHLLKEFKSSRHVYYVGKVLDIAAFKKLLESEWKKLTVGFSLKPELIFFDFSPTQLITAYQDETTKQVVLNMSSDEKLSLEQKEDIDQMVKKGDKHLTFPHEYTFSLGQQLVLFNVSPHGHTLNFTNKKDIGELPQILSMPKRKAVKIFQEFQKSILGDVDGYFIRQENIPTLEELVLAVEKINTSNILPIIYKLPDSSTQKLIQQSADYFLFLRHKKNYLNLEIALPVIHSVSELTQIKRNLASFGVNRKGSLKYWLSIFTPEAVLNLTNYLDQGMDGVILNLDKLHGLLLGYSELQKDEYKYDLRILGEFISTAARVAHKNKVPLILEGTFILHPDVLSQAIQDGIYGIIVVNPADSHHLIEYVSWTEKKEIAKKIISVLPN